MQDEFGAFCRHDDAALAGAGGGPLAGLTFAVKDVFGVAGHRSGFGHPDWLRTHPPARTTAAAVRRLLDAGADMAGKTVCDELCYGLTGENVHYGTPVNPRDPARVPGGSSNGSVVAVAAELVDFALGTDCGGSVRLPASYCGVLGFRPTHGRVSTEGVIPFAPSFDVVGWFARDAGLLGRVGRLLLDAGPEPASARRLLVATDAFALVDRRVADALAPAIDAAARLLGARGEIVVGDDGLPRWMEVFRVVQASEIWANHGAWIRETKPQFGPGVRERFQWAAARSPAEIEAGKTRWREIRRRLHALLAAGDVLCLPTSPRVAPPRDAEVTDKEVVFRHQAMRLLCIAGLGGLPQVSLPLGSLDGLPLGLSFVGPPGADEALLALARELA